jgi:hypothetical protein
VASIGYPGTAKSNPFTKTDAQTIEFRVQVQADAEETVTQCLGLSRIAFFSVPSTSTLAASMPGSSFNEL